MSNDNEIKVLRTAVVGLGRAGWYMHIPEIIRNEKYLLVAVADPLEERLTEAKSEFGVNVYKSCEELLDGENLDLLVIASPTHFHVLQAKVAFEKGVDVLCDKPIASSYEEAEEMVAAMKKHNRKLTVYMPNRTYPETVALKEILAMNLIGSVYMIKRGWTRYRIRVDWQAFLKYGGGELSNSGAHFIDQLLYLSGSKIKNFYCKLKKIASKGDAEDMAKIVMETENGIILDLDINNAAAYPVTPWQILGERGSILKDDENETWKVKYFNEDGDAGIQLQNNLAANGRSYCDNQDIPWQEKIFHVSDFKPVSYYDLCHDYFALDKKPFVPASESAELMKIIETFRQSGEDK
ncbi:MAG: Gfo/Idh/MocA family oxidoreductase [Melioribacteraceae bacterium]|nr:Gfo/Idh/MocA family oxidoreductase [Melioribacteraceae bacterium]